MFSKLFLFTTTSWFLASLLTIPLLIWLWWSRKQDNSTVYSTAKSLGSTVESLGTPNSLTRIDVLLLLLFVLWFILSFAFRLQPYGYQEFIAFTVGPLGYIVAVRNGAKAYIDKYKYIIAWGATVLLTLLSVQALIQFITQHSPRLYGLFQALESYTNYPNTFALVFLLLVPFGGFLVLNANISLRQRVIAVGASLLNIAAFFLTFSRGSLFAFGAGLMVVAVLGIIGYLYHKNPRLNLLKFLGGIVAIIAVAFVVAYGINELHRSAQPPDLAAKVPLTEDFFKRVGNQNVSARQSVDERLQFWRGSLELIPQYPWFGIGSDGFRFQYPRVQTELLAVSTHPHNLFIKLALENGLPAAILLLIFCFILFVYRCIEIIKSTASQQNLWDGAVLASFVMVHAHHLTDYNINAVLPWFLFWGVTVMMAPTKIAAISTVANSTENIPRATDSTADISKLTDSAANIPTKTNSTANISIRNTSTANISRIDDSAASLSTVNTRSLNTKSNPIINKIVKILTAGLLALVLIISAWFSWQYSQLKKASDFIRDDQPVRALEQLIAAPPGIFEPLRYEIAGEALLQINNPFLDRAHNIDRVENVNPTHDLDRAENPNAAENQDVAQNPDPDLNQYRVPENLDAPTLEALGALIAQGTATYPHWAESHLSQARLFAYQQQWREAADAYQKTLQLNNLNSLDWHVEYLTTLQHAQDIETLKTQESYYYKLITTYKDKLEVNEHNTIATINPAAGYFIIQIFQNAPWVDKDAASKESASYNWSDLEKSYFAIWQIEKTKFEQL